MAQFHRTEANHCAADGRSRLHLCCVGRPSFLTITRIIAPVTPWNFGDGNTSTEDNPVHTYNVAGLYTVQLTASNDCGSTTYSIAINTEPTADFTSSPASGCATLTVQFSNLSSANADSYFWEFPGGIPSNSTAYDPYVTYLVPVYLHLCTLRTATMHRAANTIRTQANYVTVYSLRTAAAFSSYSNGRNGLIYQYFDQRHFLHLEFWRQYYRTSRAEPYLHRRRYLHGNPDRH